VTSTSGEPIMKSTWICERFRRSWSSSPAENSYADPSATCDAAFSSMSVS
jgi:hypothetical protein